MFYLCKKFKRGYPVYVHGREGKEQAFFPTKEDGRYCIDDFLRKREIDQLNKLKAKYER